jgi:hypothetical protein
VIKLQEENSGNVCYYLIRKNYHIFNVQNTEDRDSGIENNNFVI